MFPLQKFLTQISTRLSLCFYQVLFLDVTTFMMTAFLKTLCKIASNHCVPYSLAHFFFSEHLSSCSLLYFVLSLLEYKSHENNTFYFITAKSPQQCLVHGRQYLLNAVERVANSNQCLSHELKLCLSSEKNNGIITGMSLFQRHSHRVEKCSMWLL